MNKIIVLSVATVAILTFSGCNDNKQEESAKATTTVEKTQSATEATKEAATKTAEAAKETATKAVEATKEVAQKATKTVKEATESAKEAVAQAADKAKEAAAKTVESAKKTVAQVADKAKEAVAGKTNAKGEAIFKKCISCHGADGKTKALGKSEIIAGQSAEDLVKKMQEYKAGTRNVAGMGTLMKGQVAPLSDEEIKAVADYIANLK